MKTVISKCACGELFVPVSPTDSRCPACVVAERILRRRLDNTRKPRMCKEKAVSA